jgi:hypothetical protein
MKIKTSELIDLALDWAVATCEGVEFTYEEHPAHELTCIQYSTDWARGGWIIEREKIFLVPSFVEGDPTSVWGAEKYDRYCRPTWFGAGPTPLIAAMRAYVASKLGDEVDVPEELC